MAACRICLSTESKMKPLHVNGYMSDLEILIGKKMGVSGMSANICYKCGYFLKKVSDFRNHCLKTDAIWKKYFRFQARGDIMLSDVNYIKRERAKLTNIKFNLVKTPSICVFNDESSIKTFSLQVISFVHGNMKCRNFTKELAGPSPAVIKSENESDKYNIDDINPSINNDINPMKDFIPKLVKIKADQPNLLKTLETKKGINLFKKSRKKIIQPKKVQEQINETQIEIEEKVDQTNYAKSENDDTDDGGRNVASNTEETPFEDMTVFNESRSDKRKKRELIKINSDEGVEVNLSVEEQKDELLKRSKEEKFVNAEFKCNYCMIIFRSEDTLKNHLEKHSEVRGNVVCEICTIRFDTHRQLLGHVRLHSFRVDCRLCGNRLRDRITFVDHMDLHKGKKYPCDKCESVFSVKAALKIHDLRDHGNQRFKCEFCHMSFRWRANIRRHRLTHIKNPTYPCKECEKTFQNMYFLRKHMRKHENKLDNYCVECDAHFSDYAALKAHYATVAKHKDPDKLKFPCDKCKKRFETEETLSRHIQNFHERIPRFSCERCGQGYATQMGLKHHTRRAHQGYRPPLIHTCHTCGKSFSAKGMLTNHLRTHTGEQPFECEHCHRRFSQQSAMKTHIKLLHLNMRRERETDKNSWTYKRKEVQNEANVNVMALPVPEFIGDMYNRDCYK